MGDEEVDALRSEFPAGPGDLPATRADLQATRVDLEARIAELRVDMHDLGRQMIMWSTGSVIAGMGLAAAIASAFSG